MEPEQLTSFLEIPESSEFPLENIPFGAVFLKQQPAHRFLATRIGKYPFMQVTGSST
jgi:hypothetical protein